MGKRQALTTSRSERLLGSYGYSHGRGTVAEEAELGEEDVWAVDDMVNGGGDDHSTNGSGGDSSPRASVESNGSVTIRSRRRVARGGERDIGGLSLAFEGSEKKTVSSRIVHQFRGQDSVASPRDRQIAASAPVNVPNWSKIYRVDSVESLHDSDDGEFNMVPPHEYLAREHRRVAENSVFEGVGRTLKGRDMSRVRDAVWSQTGFDG